MRFFKLHNSHILTFVTAVLVIILFNVGGVFNIKGNRDGTLASQLEAETSLLIDAESLTWIGTVPQEGLSSAINASTVYFLAKPSKEMLRDLFRADIRFGPEHRLINVANLTNLTRSSAGDDFKITISKPYIIVTTRALNQIRSMTIFDTEGQAFPRTKEWSWLQRILARISDFRRTGSLAGMGRTIIRFVRPPDNADIMFEGEGKLQKAIITWTDAEGERHITSVNTVTGKSESEDVAVNQEIRLPKRPVLWMVDNVRSLSWIGPGPIEWAEGRFFALRDKIRRFTYSLNDDDDGDEADEKVAAAAQRVFPALPEGLEVGTQASEFKWPPSQIKPPVFKRKRKNEGVWIPAVPEFVKTLPGAPPAVYRTYVRSDIRRPYVRVYLLAMDLRQLNLHMVAGHEDPQSTTGITGEGKLPRDEATLSRVIAAFNGAFKTMHGAYGMMVNRNVLLPPKPGAATVATFEDGTVAMGSWPKEMEIPQEMLSYRQNMDPLVEDGKVNPRRRYLWGFTLAEDIKEMNTIRSGLCMSDSGSLIYAWGEDLTATTMGIAMNAAGCSYGMHLDMNPFHTAYFFYRFEDEINLKKKLEFKSKLLFKEMRYSPNRYVRGAPKDFFFVTLKDTSPGKEWNAKDLAQPVPAFVPAVFRRENGAARMMAIDITRTSTALFPGEIPDSLAPPIAGDNSKKDADLLVELNLGAWSSARGQMAGGAVVAGMEQDRATLSVKDDGSFTVAPWPEAAPATDAVQGAWILRNGSSLLGNGHVTAVGRLDEKWLIIAEGSWNSVSGALADVGIKEAIAFKRNKNDAGVLARGVSGLMNLSGDLIKIRDPSVASFKINSHPRSMGGIRLFSTEKTSLK